mgnify:FL=1|tara:strand:+ start:70 stop:546 length:477 start_codon:yes stop_codon:yes gene_type:complete
MSINLKISPNNLDFVNFYNDMRNNEKNAFFLNWKNFTKEKISATKSWIIRKDHILFTVLVNKCPCGYVKLINPTFGESSKDILEIGIYIDENFRKKGIAAFALNEAKKIFKNKIFVAAVLKNNLASQKLFESTGYKDFKVSSQEKKTNPNMLFYINNN